MSRRVILAALLASSGGCFDFDLLLGPSLTGWESRGGCLLCDGFWLQPRPGFTTLLIQDTMRVDIGFASTTQARVWRVGGAALRIEHGDSLTRELALRSPDVLLRAVAPGRDTLRAEAADTSLQAMLALRVVDSASITGIAAHAPDPYVVPLNQAISIWVNLVDSQGEPVTWTTPSFTISDTTVARFVSAAPPAYGTSVLFQAKQQGVFDVTFGFRELRRTIRVTVTAATP